MLAAWAMYMLKNDTPGEGTVAEMKRERAQVLDRVPENAAGNLLQEDSWSTTVGHQGPVNPHQGPERHHRRLEQYLARYWTLIITSHTCCFVWDRTYLFARSRTFCSGWRRIGCTGPHDRQYETQSELRGDHRQHARQGSIGGQTPSHVCGFHLHG